MIIQILAALLVFFAVTVMFQGERGVLPLGYLGSIACFAITLTLLMLALKGVLTLPHI